MIYRKRIPYYNNSRLIVPNTKTPVLCCGFECGTVGNSFHISTMPTGGSFDTTTVRSGARSFRMQMTGTGRNVQVMDNAFVNDTVVIRMYIRFNTSLPNIDTYLFLVGTGTGRIGVAFKNSDSKIYASAGSTPSFGATGVAVTPDTWYRIDAKLVGGVGTSRSADVQVNGSACGQKTGADNTTAAGVLTLGTLQSVTMDIYYDDMTVSWTGADYPLGACGGIYAFVPTADGSHNITSAGDFKVGAAGANITNSTVNSYALIDDVPMDDITPDTDDYINFALDSGGTAEYVEHLLGPAPGVSTPVAGPTAVEMCYAHHQAAAATGTHVFKINDGGVESTVLSLTGTGQTSIRYARKHFPNATDGGAWDVSSAGVGNFNTLRTRYGFSNDGAPDQYLDCIMCEAEFA